MLMVVCDKNSSHQWSNGHKWKWTSAWMVIEAPVRIPAFDCECVSKCVRVRPSASQCVCIVGCASLDRCVCHAQQSFNNNRVALIRNKLFSSNFSERFRLVMLTLLPMLLPFSLSTLLMIVNVSFFPSSSTFCMLLAFSSSIFCSNNCLYYFYCSSQ